MQKYNSPGAYKRTDALGLQMPDRTEGNNGDDSPTPARSSSSRWLAAAIVATVVFVVVVGVAFASIFGYYPADGLSQVSADVGDEATPLVVAVARTPGGPGEWSNWARVIKYLSEELHRPVIVRYLSKEDESAEVIASEDIDIAFVCAHTYLDLVDSDSAVGVCTPIIDGAHTSRMMLLVREDDPAESFADLVDSSAAASDKSSLGGYSYLQYLAGEHDVRLDEYFSELRMGETQETNLRDVIAGDLRVTVANSAQTADWDLSKLKTIEESPPTGCPPVVVSSDMAPELRELVARILIDMNTDALLPADSHIDGFVELDHADYAFADTLRRACGSHDH